MRTFVKVKTEAYIKHNWPDCNIEQSDFLKNVHVHKMIVTVEVEVTHSDRQVEFFVLRGDILRALQSLYKIEPKGVIYELGTRSMEMVAEDLFSWLNQQYNVHFVECSEDGFFSGKVEVQI